MKPSPCLLILLLCLPCQGPAGAVLPLRDQWRAACQALASGRAGEALGLLREFADWYGDEPAVRAPEFREGWIRLWGLAALQAGSLDEAAGLLERWFAENPDTRRYRAFLRFQLAGIYRATGDGGRAADHREAFLREHPDLPECALVHWMQADEALLRGDSGTARAALQAIRETPALPPSGHALAGAALALVELAEGRHDEALALLQGAGAQDAGEVLSFWRALLAPALASALLEAGSPHQAGVAAQWFDDAGAVHQRLQGFMAAFAQRTRSGAGALPLRQSIWNAHWQGQLERLDSSLRRQLEGGSATDSLYRLRLRSLLAAEEPRLAAILSRALLDSAAEIGTELRSSAWQALVEASLKEENWDDAERHARAFQSAYPDDPALPDILFLGARVAAARSDWEAALRQVALLLEKHPEHTAAPGWRMLRADWLLQSGAPGPALEAFSALADAAPASWQPFLRFQQGRCHEALRDYPAAEDCFRAVLAMEGTTGSLCEAACAGLLKLFLRQFAAQPFAAALADYRRAFPDGLSRWTVENLAGTFAQSQGDAGRARAIFQKVAAQPHPEALYARQQLSRLHRQAGDLDGLLGHALDWIDAGLCGHQPLSQEAFADALHYQRATGKTAVPADLARSLHREIEAGHPDLPVNACLELFADQWEAYRESLGAAGPFTEWLEDSARKALREERWPAYAGYQLEAARLFEAAGRPDSADARRIHLLQSVDPALLGEAALLAAARTAHAYDFPEAEDLLDRFLTRFARSGQRPDALLLLAELRRRRGDDASAFAQLGEIVREWPDAAAFEPAALRLAAWRVAEGDAPAALAALAPLLDRPGLAPRAAAEALLLRARADFLAGNPERGFLNGLRLLTLYPDFDDTTRPAIALLIEQRDALPDEQQRTALSERLQALIESYELASTHHSPNA